MVKKRKENILKKRFKPKKVLKSKQPVIVVKEREPYSVLNELNRFFKNEMEEAKKSLFFS